VYSDGLREDSSLRWVKSVPGIISVTQTGSKFFRVRDEDAIPLLAQDIFQNPRTHMFSIFNRSLEVYEEDYVNGIIPY